MLRAWRRYGIWLGLVIVLLQIDSHVLLDAQGGTTAGQGDPPVAALISISAPDEEGIVTVSGAAGAVFPAAQVAIRNLYTEEVVYTNAGITGTFSASIYGPGMTPFWISPAASIPADLRDRPGVMPGGPGTIVYGNTAAPASASQPITSILLDGEVQDWGAYVQAALGGGYYALANHDSLFVALPVTVPAAAQVLIAFTLNDTSYTLTFDPSVPQPGLLQQISPTARDLGTLPVASVVGESAVEFRIPLAGIVSDINAVVFGGFRLLQDDIEVAGQNFDAPVLLVDEQDGIVYPGGRLSDAGLVQFSAAGPLAQGASTWSARGRINTLDFSPGDTFTLELDLQLFVPELAESLVGLDLIGALSLQPVTVGEQADQNVAAYLTNNGWSNMLTRSGLAIDNVQGDVALGEVVVPAAQVIRRGDSLLAGMRFVVTLPQNLPAGLYVPAFQGKAQVGDGTVFSWRENGVLGTGAGISQQSIIRLPLVLNVGGIADARLPWTLFYDTPSDGSRGVLAEADQGRAALSNRVRFNSATIILPPGAYPIEPYLLNQLPNLYDSTAAPLLPLLFPGGRLDARITRPDGNVDDPPGAAVVQNQLSTATIDERQRFGAQSPVNVYRLTTLNPVYTEYAFTDYGAYTVTVEGSLEDIYGNRYIGGGDYNVLIAEPLDLTPGVLSGTPFHVGDVFYPGGSIAPGVPAEMTMRVQVFRLDGETETFEIITTANGQGDFLADEQLVFTAPGEYIIDYEARYTGDDGRLWAASLRSAGVVVDDTASLVLRGVRGLAAVTGDDSLYRPAWFTTEQYPPENSLISLDPRPNYPYHPGDIAYVPDRPESGLQSILQVQDQDGNYAEWLAGTIPDYVLPQGVTISRAHTLDMLPLMPLLGGGLEQFGPALLPEFLVNRAYGYISAVRPDVTARQMVLGSTDGGLPLYWDADDPYNGQIGAGSGGDRSGDYLFLFGGAVVRNAEAGLRETLAYASMAVVVDEDAPAGVVPPYDGAAGGPSLGALQIVDDAAVDVFFHPTGVQPGQVMSVGERFAFAGQAAPPLRSTVEVIVTAPDGSRHLLNGSTSSTGYYYDPAQDFTVDQAGIWLVEVVLYPDAVTSAGVVSGAPQGGILGISDGSFPVYVTEAAAVPLTWNQGGDVDMNFPPASLFNFGVDVPAGWSDVTAYYTLRSASQVYETGTLQVFGSTVSYQFNPTRLNGLVPAYEVDGRGTGAASSDVLTLTFAVSGVDAEGEFGLRTRTFEIFHDQMRSFEEFGSNG